MKRFFRKLANLFNALAPRERMLVGITGVVALIFLLMLPIQALSTLVDDNERLTTMRAQQRENIATLAKRYKELDSRLKRIRESFAQSEMSFEQVTAELDRIVKDSLGSSNYTLNRYNEPQALDADFEKQDFRLMIREATLQQLVRLLHEIEQGKSPLFMGKVDILPEASSGKFSATIEVASVSRRRSTQPSNEA